MKTCGTVSSSLIMVDSENVVHFYEKTYSGKDSVAEMGTDAENSLLAQMLTDDSGVLDLATHFKVKDSREVYFKHAF